MAPERCPAVRIERHDFALPPDDQLALAIKLDSPGPVLFKQKRYGYQNQSIKHHQQATT